MAKIERGGVRLVVENYEAFNRQLSAASASMRDFGGTAQATAQQVNASASEYAGSRVVIEEWTETVDDSAEQAALAAQNMQMLGLELSAVGAAGLGAVTGLGLFASRNEELAKILEITRKNAVNALNAEGEYGRAAMMTAEAVQAQVDGFRDLHLSGRVAIETVAALIRYNLDWTRSNELARLAQDAATYAMQDSSQAVEGLIHGITTLQPRILRSYGIMVNLNEAYRVFAERNGLVATNLTQAQRQQAAFNAVLDQAPAIAGAYEASMETAAKQLRSLNTDTQDLFEALGEHFVPILNTAVVGLRDLIHWVTDLSDPMQSFLVYATAAGSALSSITGAAILLIPRIKDMIIGFKGLAAAIGLSNVALSAFLVGIPLIIGAIAALKEAEDARKEEAAALVASTDTYNQYVGALHSAGLENYTLSESLYNTVKAHQDAADAATAQAEAEGLLAAIQETKALALHSRMERNLERMNKYLIEHIQNMDDDRLALYANAEAMTELYTEMGNAEEEARQYAEALAKVAQAQLLIQSAEVIAEDVAKWGHYMREAAIATDETTNALENQWQPTARLTQYWSELNQQGAQYIENAKNLTGFTEDINRAMDRSSKAMEDAVTKRNRALYDLDLEYQQKAEDAWIDYQRAISAGEEDLAKFHAGTLQELLDLDREYLQDRNDAWTTYQQDLADAERDLQRDIEDANRKRAEDLADLDREYAQDRADERRELLQDLEDMQEEHAKRLQDIEDERHQSLLDLEEEYQQKRYDIEHLAEERLRELRESYAEKDSDLRLEYARRAIELIKSMGIATSAEWQEALINMFRTGAGPEDLLDILPQDVALLFKDLLDELAALNEDLLWDERDLSDDIDREQDKRREDLEEWLAEERNAIEQAYQERLAQEQERIEREQAERQREYEDKLADLQLARQREREEIARDHQRKLDDLRIQHEREREQIALNYQRRLEDLQIQYEREKEQVRLKLEEQNDTARQKYDEALEDLARAKERERNEINTQYARTKDDIATDLEDIIRTTGEKWNLLPEAMRPAYRVMQIDLHNLLYGDSDSLANQWTNFINDLQNNILQARSPSRIFMKLGESITGGLEKGVGTQSISDLLTDSFDIAAFEANINAALPTGRMSMPMGTMGSTRSTTYQDNLTINAQYQHQSETSLRNDLALWQSMMWARRR